MNETRTNEVNGSHLNFPDLIIKTGIYNSPQEYHLANQQGYSDNEPFVYIDYELTDTVYAGDHLFSGIMENNHGFTISMINSSNKYSLNFLNCTGIVAVGVSKSTGQNVSILTHQDPQYFLSKKKTSGVSGLQTKQSYFIECIEKIMQNLKDECEDGTIDVVIFGGNSNNNFSEYKASISLLESTLSYIFGFYPVIVGGPSSNNESFYKKGVFLDTKNRRVHYYKHNTNCSNNIISTTSEVNRVLKLAQTDIKSAFLCRLKKILNK